VKLKEGFIKKFGLLILFPVQDMIFFNIPISELGGMAGTANWCVFLDASASQCVQNSQSDKVGNKVTLCFVCLCMSLYAFV